MESVAATAGPHTNSSTACSPPEHTSGNTRAQLAGAAPARRGQLVGRGARLRQRAVQRARGAHHGSARQVPAQRVGQQRVRDQVPPARAGLPHHGLRDRAVLGSERSVLGKHGW